MASNAFAWLQLQAIQIRRRTKKKGRLRSRPLFQSAAENFTLD
jgi:hypothetical protein